MRKWIVISLLALFVGGYLLPLGARPLLVPDECRYAEIPREMLASGDWVVPRVDGVRYFEKPVLGYWLTGASMSLFGQNNFAVRLPAALSAGATALVVFLLARRFGGGLAPAATAAGVLLTCGLFFAIGCANILDMPLTFFLTAALASFFWAYVADGTGKKAAYLALFGLFCGAAFLVKGFLAFAVPCAVILPFMVWERRTSRLFRLAWIPLIVTVAVAAPWAILIHGREPGFWSYFLWEEHVRRFFSSEAQHAEPLWFFVPVILGGAVPWTVLAPAAAMGYRRDDLKDRLVRFALCWLVFLFLFFSVSKGKLATYILPCFPALALLVATGLIKYLAQATTKAFATGAWVLAGILAAGILVFCVWQWGGIANPLFGAGERWKCALILLGICLWVLLLWLSSKRRDPSGKVLLFSAAPVALMALSHFLLPASYEGRHAPGRLLMRNAARVAPDAPILTRIGGIHAVCWYYKRADVHVLDPSGEIAYGFGFADAKKRGVKLADFSAFLAGCAPGAVVTAVLGRDYYTRWKASLPQPVYEDGTEEFVFLQFAGGRRAE